VAKDYDLINSKRNNTPLTFDFIGKEFWSTRDIGGVMINQLYNQRDNIINASADLYSACKNYIEAEGAINLKMGVREHAMAAICNGLAMHGYAPYCSTFLTFSDYMRSGIRLSALMNLPVTYILTHDSIGVGEDGATHQPIEHINGLRAIPNFYVFRPSYEVETAAAFKFLNQNKKPGCVLLSRHSYNKIENESLDNTIKHGAYVIYKGKKNSNAVHTMPDVNIVAAGREVGIAVEAAKELEKLNICAFVISMPCNRIFDSQPTVYKESVLPKNVPTIAVEAGDSSFWYKYADTVIGIDQFGASAPFEVLYKHFGITKENVVAQTKKLLGKR
ncbi:MAG: transketolase, partial [Firmicutes bacterium]|nr:transketolase [Bacillota bacterium]